MTRRCMPFIDDYHHSTIHCYDFQTGILWHYSCTHVSIHHVGGIRIFRLVKRGERMLVVMVIRECVLVVR